MNVLVVKNHDLDTKVEPEQKEIADTFKMQHQLILNSPKVTFYHGQNDIDTCKTQPSETFKLEFMLDVSELNWCIYRRVVRVRYHRTVLASSNGLVTVLLK